MRLSALFATFALLSGTAFGQVVNGSFEPTSPTAGYQLLGGGSTAIPGWTTTDSGLEWYIPAAFGDTPAPDGDYVVDLANYTFSAGGIAQTFPTVPGRIYEIGFHLGTSRASGRDGTCEIVVAAGSSSEVYSAVNPSGAMAYMMHTFTFAADAAVTTLSLRCLQNANLHFAIVDAVSVGAPVAELENTWSGLKALYAE